MSSRIRFSSPGWYAVTVITSDGDEASGTFLIDSPTLPNITGISPSSATVGQPNTWITVTGPGFIAGGVSGIYFTSQGIADSAMTLTTSSVSDTQLVGNLSIAPTAIPGGRGVAIILAGQPSGTPLGFTVEGDATPVITSINPANFTAGTLGVPVTA